MTPPDKNTTNLQQLTTTTLKPLMVDILRDYVGPGRARSYEVAADDLGGIEARTVKGWCLGENLPPMASLLRLMVVLGPVFTNRVLRLAGYEGAGQVECEQVSASEVITQSAELISAASSATADGHIDHRELPGLMRRAALAETAIQRFMRRLSKRGVAA